MPTQSWDDGTYCGPTWAIVAGSTVANRPSPLTVVMAGEFSVRKTSAADLLPSVTSCAAIEESLP